MRVPFLLAERGSRGLLSRNSSDEAKRMPTKNLRLLRALRWSYILGLTLIGVLSLAGHLLLDEQLKSQERMGAIINLAGRQRMLSERILRLLGDTHNNDKLLAESCSDFELAHQLLFSEGQPARDLAPPGLETYHSKILQAGRGGRRDNSNLVELKLWQRQYVERMELVVERLGLLSDGNVRFARILSSWMLAGVFLCLIAEALGIFRPLVARIEAATDALVQSNQLLDNKRRELAALNVDLKNFTFATSHDLKEPVRTTKLYLQMLQEQLQPELNGEAKELIGEAIAASERSRSMLDGLGLLLAEPDPSKELISGKAVLLASVGMLQELIESHQASVTIDVEEFQVRAGTSNLERLYIQILRNAILYSRESGPPVVEVRSERKENTIVLSFRDNGVGIAKEYLELVFHPFRRLHGRSEVEGSGLGLPLCRRLALHIGGEIHLESEPQLGTTVFLSLPLADGREF